VQLQTFIKNKREQGRVALLGVKTSSSVWHKRLGHPHDQILSRVLKSQLLSVSLSQRQLSLCLPCQVTKSRQLPFSHSQHVTTSPLELLHSDIWCSPVSSLSGCNYYVVFVDDFSRYSWFFPLIHKSEVLGCFIKLTEGENTHLMPSQIVCPNMVFFIESAAHIHPKNMGLPKENIDILLKWTDTSCSIPSSIKVLG